jgi:RNA polymerase sigma-70 factor (ECF subfamily)
MEKLPTHEVTALLQAWNSGDELALQKLTPLIYEELYRSAKRSLSRGRRDNSMQTTALINELYVRMLDVKPVTWQNRAHFFAICARLMREHSGGCLSCGAISKTWRRRHVNYFR